MANAQDATFHATLIDTLKTGGVKNEIRGQVLAALSFLDDLPEPLRDGVLLGLNSGVSELKEEALNIAQRFKMSQPILDAISAFAKNENEQAASRASAIQVLVNHEKPLSDTSLAFLTKLVIDKDAPVLLGRQAAQALGSLRLRSLGKSQSEGGVEASSMTAGVGARMAEVQEKAQMRGQRLNEAEERSSQLAEAAGEYSSLAARLAKKQEQKNRWPFLG